LGGISFRVACMRQDKEILFFLKPVVNFFHVCIESRTYPATRCKKIFCHVYLSLDILVCHDFSILVDKCEWLNDRDSVLSFDPGPDGQKKNSYQCNKKHAIKRRLLRHRTSLFYAQSYQWPNNYKINTKPLKNVLQRCCFFINLLFYEIESELGHNGNYYFCSLRNSLCHTAFVRYRVSLVRRQYYP